MDIVTCIPLLGAQPFSSKVQNPRFLLLAAIVTGGAQGEEVKLVLDSHFGLFVPHVNCLVPVVELHLKLEERPAAATTGEHRGIPGATKFGGAANSPW